MTDSGSFDSGDLVYGADINALINHCNAVCSAAGVAGVQWGGLAGGEVIAAADMNTIVAAYQRAWDASANKPGTRQDQVSAGGLIYGALLQNMWTQLNQMTFSVSWADWPENSEATLQSATTYVALMENPTANGDEAGQGGGLSGSDLTLTLTGNIPGAAGSPPYRDFTSNGYFTHPPVGAFLAGRNVYTILTKLTIDTTKEQGIFSCPSFVYLFQRDPAYGGELRCDLICNGTYVHNNMTADALTTGTWYFAVWGDGSTHRYGFCATKPTKLSDFSAGKVVSATSSLAFAGSNGMQFGAIGTSYLDAKAYYYVLSKSCLINNAA